MTATYTPVGGDRPHPTMIGSPVAQAVARKSPQARELQVHLSATGFVHQGLGFLEAHGGAGVA